MVRWLMGHGYSLIALCLMISLSVAAQANVVQNPDSPFGVICSWGGIKDAGVKWVRCGAGCTALDWGAVEKDRGVYDWKQADSEVYGWTKNEGVDLLVILGYTPQWASSHPDGKRSYPPANLEDWSNFVYTVVDRYKHKIKYWEVWNEPDIGFFTGTIEDYTDLLKSAYVAAKKADPDCRIVFGGTAGVNLPFIRRVYELGGGPYFDVMAVHPYQWGDTFNDEWFSLQLRDLYRLMRKQGDAHKEVWLTEFGWSTGAKAITEEIQARLLAQCFIASLSLPDANLTKAFWFSVKDWGGPDHGLHRPDGSRKPAFDAYRFVTESLEGTKYVGPVEHDQLRCHMFSKNGKPLLAAWHPGKESAVLELPADTEWTEIRQLKGNNEVPAAGRKSLKVGPDPVFIIGSGEVSIPRRSVRKPPAIPRLLDVWCSLPASEETSRLFIVRGKPQPITVRAHNDSDTLRTVEIRARVGAFRSAANPILLAAGDSREIALTLTLPAGFKTGISDLHITGTADGKPTAPIKTPVRVSDGKVVEFLANSMIENRYLLENENSGGAPSVRFSGTWTYKFDLTDAKSAVLDLCVGAHEAKEWEVLTSSDGKTWTTALSGASDRSWQKADVSAYFGGLLFVKFAGNGQQLSELILSTIASQ